MENNELEFITLPKDLGGLENVAHLSGGYNKPVSYGKDKKGILIMGLNPAGDKKDADKEKELGFLYLYYILEKYGINKSKLSKRSYPRYFKPIWEFVDIITQDNMKWDWCNYPKNVLESLLKQDSVSYSRKDIEEILKFYDDRKDKKYTIYIGDFFYYHMTKQSDFVKEIGWKEVLNEKQKFYIKTSLEKHIDEFEKVGTELKLIYINNALASKWLCQAINCGKYDTEIKYHYKGKVYNIVLGGMLSGQRAIDVFSKERLINEIKNNITL